MKWHRYMADNSILDRNLVALSTRHSGLAYRLTKNRSPDDLSVMISRSQHPVPVLEREGRPFPMHSRFDPVSEGRRIADDAPEGYLVAFGLGGGYHLTPLLERRTLTGLVIVETEERVVRGLLEIVDLTALLSDSRVILLVAPSPDQLVQTLLDRYIPVLYGNLGSITLRSRWDAAPEWFSSLADALRGLPEALGRDYTVQTRFGRRWFVHTLINLARSEDVGVVLPPARRYLITAAGPSLEDQLPQVRMMQADGATLLATDTTLPLLISAGLVPDIVLSIDCQAVSYHHFFKRLPRKTVLILDLASPPVLTRQSDRILFFSSSHPFSLYLNRFYRPFPILDLSGGNVTHAAASLAREAGAREVFLFGADFSYPSGRPYARDTYLYPYFQSRSSRTGGSEDLFWSFIMSSRPRREMNAHGWLLRTSSMDHYRESLERSLDMADFVFHAVPGKGVPISTKKKTALTGNQGGLIPIISAGAVSMGWRDFLDDYGKRLAALPPLNGPPQDYLEDLGTENRQAWATLLPSAATFRNESPDGPAALEKSRIWTLERTRTLLKRNQGTSQITEP